MNGQLLKLAYDGAHAIAHRLNTALPGRYQWYPLGTHIANAAACACIYAAEAVLDVRSGYWLTVVLGGVTSGFCGALSTVSTFVNEVRRRSGCGTALGLLHSILSMVSYHGCKPKAALKIFMHSSCAAAVEAQDMK